MKNCWTTGEIRQMRAAHSIERPSRADLCAMFTRHTPMSIYATAAKLGLRKWPTKVRNVTSAACWLRRAHDHFARREAGLLA